MRRCSDKTCPCCRGALHRIGEEHSAQLDVVPARLRVLVTVRPRYACDTCEEAIVQARLIQGGRKILSAAICYL